MLLSFAWTLSAAWYDRLAPYLPVLGLLLIVLSLFFSIRKRRKTPRSEPTAREQLERTNQQQGMRDDLQSLMVEIEQMAKRLSSQIDSKTVRLEKLLSEADHKIDQLERMTGQTAPPGEAASSQNPGTTDSHGSGSTNGSSPSMDHAGSSASAATWSDQANDPTRFESSALSSSDALDQPSASRDVEARGMASSKTGHAALPQAGYRSSDAHDDPLTRSIYELADAGKAAQQIASELNEHTGKVELILALRRT